MAVRFAVLVLVKLGSVVGPYRKRSFFENDRPRFLGPSTYVTVRYNHEGRTRGIFPSETLTKRKNLRQTASNRRPSCMKAPQRLTLWGEPMKSGVYKYMYGELDVIPANLTDFAQILYSTFF